MTTKRKIWIVVACLLVVTICSAIIRPYYLLLTDHLHVSPISVIFGLNKPQSLDGRINILLLGVPGGDHDGPNLSDSINVLSYDTKTNTMTSIGIPRDMYSSTIYDKINAAYAYGEAAAPGRGTVLAKAEVSGIIGLPIHYAIVIKFAQFRELIDYLGGVDVAVEKSFTDHEFPITGRENDLCGGDPEYHCRYETISFTQGVHRMDGETALKYVRSRHAVGEQGSDFSRNMRQQTVIRALRAKILSPQLLSNPTRMQALYDELNKLVSRDISNEQAAYLGREIILKGHFAQRASVIDRQLLEVPDTADYGGKYVLVPKSGNFDEIHAFVRNQLK